MADNYTQTTVEPSDLILTPLLLRALKAHDAGFEGTLDEGVLEKLARGDGNYHDVYIFFENGWSDFIDGWDEDAPVVGDLSPEETAEYRRLVKLDEADLFREILLVNPEVKAIQVRTAYHCSKLRPGEFGGGCLYVTRTHHCFVGDTSAAISDDGQIQITAKVETFK